MTVKRTGPFDAPITAACSCLVGLVLLALLCLGRPDGPAFPGAAPGDVSVSLERHGEVAALLRVTGKAPALEVRTGRPLLAKFASGNPALPPPEAAFLWLDRVSQAEATVTYATSYGAQARANQPRAPPSV